VPRFPKSFAHTRARTRAFSAPGAELLRLMVWSVLVAAAPPLLADPVPATHEQCPVASPEQARHLGDELFEQGAYQRAGECYATAGQYALANRAFVKAVRPQSESASHQVSVQRDQAQDLLHRVQKAFRTEH